MYKYETHLHTSPVSACAKATPEETVKFYKEIGYDGIFITNHFLDGNTKIDRTLPWEEQINLYCADFEEALKVGEEIGLKVFFAVEMSYLGTDFLVYGLDKQWYINHPEIMTMKKSAELNFLKENGAFIIQAHPYRGAEYIDHIRLYPMNVEGVEIINASRSDFENGMALPYADSYKLMHFAGSDNHNASRMKKLAGMECSEPINSVEEFINAAREGKLKVFTLENKTEE